MKQTPSQPLFTMSSPEPRRKRIVMKLFMVVMVVLAIFAAFKILPGTSTLTDSGARKLIVKAAKDASDGFPADAAQKLERIARAEGVNKQLRLDANRRLVELYRGPLKDPAAAQFAQSWINKQAGGAALQEPALAAADGSTTETTPTTTVAPPVEEPKVVARIGNEEVTAEQVIYAWMQFHPNAPPQGPEYEKFMGQYLNMVLLADEATRQGLDKKGQLALDLQLNRIVTLNKAIAIQLINQLKAPSEQQLIDFAQKTWGGEGDPTVDLGVIVVDKRSDAAAVQQRLKAGEDIAKVAAERSTIKRRLEDGYKVGPVSAKDPEIKELGRRKGLAARLMSYADGTTTGPLRVEDGYAVVKIIGHKPGRITSIKGMEDQVLAAYQRLELGRKQQELIDRLRRESNIEIMQPPAPAQTDGVTTATAP